MFQMLKLFFKQLFFIKTKRKINFFYLENRQKGHSTENVKFQSAIHQKIK